MSICKDKKNNLIYCQFFWLVLVVTAGICSGLNVGLLSIDIVALKIKLKNGTKFEKESA